MDTASIIKSIVTGERDDDLSALKSAVEMRSSFVAESRVFSAKPGDIVIFASTIRPAYLAGRTARVTGITRGKRGATALLVSMDRRIGRFHENITVPASLIERIDKPNV